MRTTNLYNQEQAWCLGQSSDCLYIPTIISANLCYNLLKQSFDAGWRICLYGLSLDGWKKYRSAVLYKGLPRGCWHCEVLGLCRRPKEEGWKCYNGCMVLNWENERKYEGLPRGCWSCKYLTECRRPKEAGWKCYNGCRVINERKAKRQKLWICRCVKI